MRVAGVQLTASAVAHLVVLLNRARYTNLAQRLGRALDANSLEAPITNRDHQPMRNVLTDVENGPLANLKDALQDDGSSPAHLD